MKTTKDLKYFYETTLRNDLVKLEEERKALIRKLTRYCGITGLIILTIFIIYIILSNDPHPGGIFIIGIIIMAIGCITWYCYYFVDYQSKFKDVVIRQIIKFIDDRLIYQKSECIPEYFYKRSGLFRKRYNSYKGDDLVRGTLDKTEIVFSELHTKYKTRNSKGRSQTHTIFRGLFFVGDFNKAFKGKTYVMPDYAEMLFGGFGKMLQSFDKTKGDLVKLEDPEFENEFKVYADDQIEARYILSTSLMRNITEFKQRYGKTIHLAFVNSSVFVAISYNKALFEPKLFTSLLDFEPIKEYFDDLCLCINIVEELNLNTRIWSKE